MRIRKWLPHKVLVQSFWKEFVKYENENVNPTRLKIFDSFLDFYGFVNGDHVTFCQEKLRKVLIVYLFFLKCFRNYQIIWKKKENIHNYEITWKKLCKFVHKMWFFRHKRITRVVPTNTQGHFSPVLSLCSVFMLSKEFLIKILKFRFVTKW